MRIPLLVSAALALSACVIQVPAGTPVPALVSFGGGGASPASATSSTPAPLGRPVLITLSPAPSPTPTPKALEPYNLYPQGHPWPLPSAMCDEAFARLDANRDGYISKSEYQAFGFTAEGYAYTNMELDDRGIRRRVYGFKWCGGAR